MLFHEIYSAYYNAVAEILRRAVRGELNERDMKSVCDEAAFSESFLSIIPALRSGEWQLLHPDMTTPLRNEPEMPLTLMQRRWLKAVSLDPRMKLFGLDWSFLGDVQPLFTADDIVVFDKYADGDPYEDEHYIDVFRTLLEAVKCGSSTAIVYNSTKGNLRSFRCRPLKLEYSEKDDKFRVRVEGCRNIGVLNLAGIESVSALQDCRVGHGGTNDPACCIEAELIDERNALERAMLHFAHFEKETERLSEGRYRLRLTYSKSDETELVIRLLSFGPMIRVTAPDSFVEGIRQRLERQHSMGLR
ncbi:MAG: WYL domain-containing protein [Ruminococcaceae bacterium]|nr:WYL domain-containing protein [Oscillospiraceae bacterium]